MVFLIEGKHNYNNCYSNESTAGADTSVELGANATKHKAANSINEFAACRQNPEQRPKSQGNSKSAWVIIDHDCSYIRLMAASAEPCSSLLTLAATNS